MGLLLKSLSHIDSLKPAAAIEPSEAPPHRALVRKLPRGDTAPAATAVPLEFEASTVDVAARHGQPATPLAIDTSTVCLTVPADEPSGPPSEVPISLDALFAAPFPSAAKDGAARAIAPTAALAPQSKLPASPQTASSDLATTLDRLEELQKSLGEDFAQPEAAPYGPSNAPQATALAPPQLRPEFRELCDHLLSRFPLTKHCTLLLVDAGRAPLDHTWLLPLAAGLLDSISDRHPRALLVEVEPCDGIAQMLGIDATFHSLDRASDTAAFSNTYHPQIDILRLGASSLATEKTRLEETWTELQESYNLIVVAAGPLASDANGRDGDPPNQIVGSLLPLADAVILSVELGSTPVSVARQTAELLKAAGANLLGCVVQAASVTG